MRLLGTLLDFYGISGSLPDGDSGTLASAALGEPLNDFPPAPLTSFTIANPSTVCLHHGCTGTYDVRAASIVGRAHADKGRSCEDSFALRTAPDGGLVIAVCDGVGDSRARFSHIGARACASAAVDVLAGASHWLPLSRFVDDITCLMLDYAQRLMGTDGADRSAVSDVDLSCTLIVVCLEATGEFSSLSVGDSGTAQLGVSGQWTQHRADDRDYANVPNGTFPTRTESPRLHHGSIAPGEALVIATDGVLDPLRDPEVARYLGNEWSDVPEPAQFLAGLSFAKRAENDDRTAVVVWRRDGHE